MPFCYEIGQEVMMKKLGFAFFLLWVIVSAQSYGQEVFTSSSDWNNYGAMDVLEVEGITMHAIEKALDECRERGNRLCAFKSSDITEHNSESRSSSRRRSKVEVVLQALDGLSVVESRAYTKEETWYFSAIGGNRLDFLGVKRQALSAAISRL